MSIQKPQFIGKYRPPQSSNHAKRIKSVWKGIDSDTGQVAYYYESNSGQIRIDSAEFQRWRRDFR